MAKLRVDKIASVGVSTETTGSVFFDGTGDYLQIPQNTDFVFGTGDFTVECWIYPNTISGYRQIAGHTLDSNDMSVYLKDGVLILYTDGDITFGTGTVSANSWTHIAVTRQNGVVYGYYNGVLNGSTSFTTSLNGASNYIVGINPTDLSSEPFLGYISNLRVCKGHAVYTSNFAVPTRELDVHEGPDDDRTVLLCCHDGEDIFADKTGRHIIAAYGDRISSPTPTATDSPIGITTFQPGLTRDVDPTAGPVFQGGAGFTSQNWLTLPKGTTTQRNRGRGLFGGGNTPTAVATIDFVQIQTQGNAQDFGDLTSARQASGLGSATRGVFGGTGHPNGNIMDFVTFATTSNAVDFGDLQSSLNGKASAANSTRGIFSGGGTPTPSNEIDFITIATLGNATDFGNLTVARRNHAGVASPTRAVFAGGDAAPTTDTIDYITIATTGNAIDFGNLSAARETAGGASSSTRGVFMGGYTSPGDVDVIEYITIATTGNAQDFGNLSAARRNGCGVSNNIRGLYAGGHPAVNTIEFVTIASTGDSTDFGDLLTGRLIATNGASDSHGGLS